MNFGLLWIDALLIAVLWVAALAACVGRLKRKWLRVALMFLVVLIPLGLLGLYVLFAANLKFALEIEPNWFVYALSLLLASIVVTVMILRRAARREPGMPPNAATWHRGALGFAWLTAVAVGYMTLVNMDLAMRARCAILSVQLNSVYLATLPAVTSDAQNAAPIYEKAFARLHDAREDEKKVDNPPTGDSDRFDPNEPATLAFLAGQAETISELRRAAAMPACRFDADLMGPELNVMLPVLNEERNAANVLGLDAHEAMARGRTSLAIDDVQTIFGMSRHFGQRPLLVSGLVGIGIDGLGSRMLEDVLPMVKSQDELAGLKLEQLPSLGQAFRQALLGEECFGVILYANFPQSAARAPQSVIVQSLGDGLEGTFVRTYLLGLDAYVDLLTQLQEMAKQPYYLEAGRLNSEDFYHGGGLMMSILAPSMRRALQSLAQGEARELCAQTAVAMTRYRLDHGTLPSHLGDLVPGYMQSVPLDPFDGHPLRLVTRDGKWIVYSIGPDGVDDGGAELLNGKGDITFTLNLAKANAASNR